MLAEYLGSTLEMCRRVCNRVGIHFEADLLQQDFIRAAVDQILVGFRVS